MGACNPQNRSNSRTKERTKRHVRHYTGPEFSRDYLRHSHHTSDENAPCTTKYREPASENPSGIPRRCQNHKRDNAVNADARNCPTDTDIGRRSAHSGVCQNRHRALNGGNNDEKTDIFGCGISNVYEVCQKNRRYSHQQHTRKYSNKVENSHLPLNFWIQGFCII